MKRAVRMLDKLQWRRGLYLMDTDVNGDTSGLPIRDCPPGWAAAAIGTEIAINNMLSLKEPKK